MKLASELIEFSGSDGNNLVAEAWGEPGAEPVLLLHGAGQTRHAWGATARALAGAGWRAYALDMRGHGDSDWHPLGHYNLNHYVADLLAVRKQIEQKPALVGASLGGLTALLCSGGTPGFSSLTLVDVTPRLQASGVERILKFMRAHLDGFADLDEAAKSIADYLPDRKPTPDKSGLLKNLRLRRDSRYYWHWDPRLLDHIGHIESDLTQRLLEAAAQLAIPTLIVRGRMSDVVSESAVRELLALVPHAQYVDIGGAGHMVSGDRNDVFSESVCEFLASAAGNSGAN